MQGRLHFLHCLIKHENRYFPLSSKWADLSMKKERPYQWDVFYNVPLNHISMKDSD